MNREYIEKFPVFFQLSIYCRAQKNRCNGRYEKDFSSWFFTRLLDFTRISSGIKEKPRNLLRAHMCVYVCIHIYIYLSMDNSLGSRFIEKLFSPTGFEYIIVPFDRRNSSSENIVAFVKIVDIRSCIPSKNTTHVALFLFWKETFD